MKNLIMLVLACTALVACRETVDRCENGELSQAECCASDSKHCLSDAGDDLGADAGSDTDVDDGGGLGCDPACTTGVCDPATDTCVACLTNDQCDGATPACDTATKTCVACLADTDCGNAGVCDTASKTCVGCLGDGDCGGETPVCDTATNACVGCLGGGDCDAGVCDTASKTCVACLGDQDCGALFCKTSATSDLNACVDCLDNTTCTDATAAKCGATNMCEACTANEDCGHIAGANQCAGGRCVECTTATEATDCLVNTEVFACDVATNTCSDILAGSRYTCGECVSNTSCGPGYACVPTNYMGAPAGNYCMQLFTGATCPSPYGGIVSTRDDIDGTEINVCMISESITTCEAYNQYSDLCNGDDALCTATGGVCKQFGLGTRRCTYACIGDSDCVNGVTCNQIGADRVCGATGN